MKWSFLCSNRNYKKPKEWNNCFSHQKFCCTGAMGWILCIQGTFNIKKEICLLQSTTFLLFWRLQTFSYCQWCWTINYLKIFRPLQYVSIIFILKDLVKIITKMKKICTLKRRKYLLLGCYVGTFQRFFL